MSGAGAFASDGLQDGDGGRQITSGPAVDFRELVRGRQADHCDVHDAVEGVDPFGRLASGLLSGRA
jgi:hypothetical protein